jgi:hypothetical protein
MSLLAFCVASAPVGQTIGSGGALVSDPKHAKHGEMSFNDPSMFDGIVAIAEIRSSMVDIAPDQIASADYGR